MSNELYPNERLYDQGGWTITIVILSGILTLILLVATFKSVDQQKEIIENQKIIMKQQKEIKAEVDKLRYNLEILNSNHVLNHHEVE